MSLKIRTYTIRPRSIRVVVRPKFSVRPSRKDTLPKLVSHLLLPRVRRPKFADSLHFPENITELASANISDLMGKYTLLLSYAQQDMAELNRETLRCDILDRNRRMELLREKPQMNSIEKHKREAFYDSDPVMRRINDQRIILGMRKEHTAMFLSNFDRYISTLSRELTRMALTDERMKKHGY